MQTLQAPKLDRCEIPEGSFSLLEEGICREESVVFLHGLGENRTGVNYLFRDLSRALQNSYTVYRFDLAGCGDSTLPLSMSLWEKQIETLQKKHLGKYRKTHWISRGLSACLLPEDGIAIAPPIPGFILETLPKIPLEPGQKNWTPLGGSRTLSPSEEAFWHLLGVEAGCLGGFSADRRFIETLSERTLSTRSRRILYSKNGWPFSLPIEAKPINATHSLFLFEQDRKILSKTLYEMLNGKDP